MCVVSFGTQNISNSLMFVS